MKVQCFITCLGAWGRPHESGHHGSHPRFEV